MNPGNIIETVRLLTRIMARPKNIGWCPVCSSRTLFIEFEDWLRDYYQCIRCCSIPRNRALIQVLTTHFPEYRSYTIHESSPAGPASEKIARDCSGYVPTQFFADTPYGAFKNGVRCENLECMTFPDNSFDLVITQDVFEHVMHPDRAFAEIARTLKPGGAHLFTVPLVNKYSPSKQRAGIINGEVNFFEPEIYHGNPVGDGKSLVTVDWGFDICRYIFDASGLFTQLIYIDDISKGIRAEYIEVLITYKPNVRGSD